MAIMRLMSVADNSRVSMVPLWVFLL
jgi:hypothetical protein